MQSRGSDHVFIYALLIGVMGTLAVVTARPRRGPRPARHHEHERHPESLTADLAPDAEAYLAWLADHHWPDDEYLELERDWRMDTEADTWAGRHGSDGDAHADADPACPQCLRPGDDLWPCRKCARLLHWACGYGMRRRRLARPYRTRDMDAETVVAEWVCTDCSSVVALDIDYGPADTDS